MAHHVCNLGGLFSCSETTSFIFCIVWVRHAVLETCLAVILDAAIVDLLMAHLRHLLFQPLMIIRNVMFLMCYLCDDDDY